MLTVVMSCPVRSGVLKAEEINNSVKLFTTARAPERLKGAVPAGGYASVKNMKKILNINIFSSNFQ